MICAAHLHHGQLYTDNGEVELFPLLTVRPQCCQFMTLKIKTLSLPLMLFLIAQDLLFGNRLGIHGMSSFLPNGKRMDWGSEEP